MKKITVIIPCYNVEKYIDRCMSSVTNQTIGRSALEIICLDDCSTDGTLAKLRHWEAQYPDDILIVELPQNGRQGRARNIALSYASCEWICFVDADDWIEKDYCALLYEKAENSSYDVIACDLERDFSTELSYFTERTSPLKEGARRVTNEEERKSFFHDQVLSFAAYCKLIRKELLTENGILFTEGLAYEDTYWGVLLNLYAKSCYTIPFKLYHYFVNPSSTVLGGNADHHLDLLTNQELLWDELVRRGFMDWMRPELEYEYVYSCCLAFWKVIVYRYDTPSYSKYRLLSAVVCSHIPDIMENPYVKGGAFTEFYLLILKSLLHTLSKDEFMTFAAQIKKIGL